MNNMSAKAQNLVHSAASPEELSGVISSSKVTGLASASAAADFPSGITTWG
jgi:hypothetical protein